MYLKPPFVLMFFLTLISQAIQGQEKSSDSLQDKSFEYLKSAFEEYEDNHKVSIVYVNAWIKKASREKDTFNLAYAYLYKSCILHYEGAIAYSDSIIALTKNYKNNEFPALGYMLKGYYNYDNGDDKKALKLYLIAYEYALKNNNINQQIEIKQFIGGLKTIFGQYDEALKIFREQLKFLESQPNYKKKLKKDYIIALNDLSKAYLRGEILDSASIRIKEGLDFSLKTKDSLMYSTFLLDSGTLLYFENDYKGALDSLKKVEPLINDISLANCYYYQGKIYKHRDINKTISYFNKVDSIYTATENPFIELKDTYKTMYDFYSKQGNVNKQLYFVDKLIKVDSLLNNTIKNINKEVINHYEVPKLKNEKGKLIIKINNEKDFNKKITFLVFFIILLFSSISFFFYNNQKKYKKRFNELLNKNLKTQKISITQHSENNSINISEKIINSIISKLDEFENKKKYLEQGIVLNKLAKDFNTNSVYLSKVINHNKGITFSNYLNGLRINHCIEELKTNYQLRAYTIKAISYEVGFSNSESFSKAFFNKTGIKPSFFIKELNKLARNS
ncbi:helix-turn-helix domain-containing protein [Flavivirga jejuensis]|uniref:AraC family transcriptional regulator n=1 Tax=Flavivirga jejuensis TaxID=870487 RepID=A0ABT8WWB6_9FLAO|nr:helix-turn-helix domain-containing protein [Flavivirga jejuensis]MDO5977171.1 AraC family transcriptional regulator [Flavivirga jejuensis]